jgi:hypothetical protein
MRLDAAASRALNVLPQRLDGSASFSLYGIMARGKTAMGKRLLKVRDGMCVLLILYCSGWGTAVHDLWVPRAHCVACEPLSGDNA